MQIHFKTKEDTIAYLEQRNAELEERISLKRGECKEAGGALEAKLKEVENRPWWVKLWSPYTKYDYYLERDAVSRLFDKLSVLSIQLLKNEEYIQMVIEAENAEGFTIEVLVS